MENDPYHIEEFNSIDDIQTYRTPCENTNDLWDKVATGSAIIYFFISEIKKTNSRVDKNDEQIFAKTLTSIYHEPTSNPQTELSTCRDLIQELWNELTSTSFEEQTEILSQLNSQLNSLF